MPRRDFSVFNLLYPLLVNYLYMPNLFQHFPSVEGCIFTILLITDFNIILCPIPNPILDLRLLSTFRFQRYSRLGTHVNKATSL